MKHSLLRSPVVLFLCSLAFGAGYLSVAHLSQGSAPAVAAPVDVTPDPAASATGAAPTPSDASLDTPTETPQPGGALPSFDQLGERAPAGTVFDKYGVRLNIPQGLGDFRVIYPVIVDWGAPQDDQHPGMIMTVYNPQTQSSLFLHFQDTPSGPRVLELGRHVAQPQADAALDSIASSMEVRQ